MVKTLVCVSAIESYGKLDEAFEKMSNVREIKSYCGIDNNKRVSVVTQKMKSNKSMASMFVWVVIVIIAFLYVVFTKQTIQKECSVLGTLMALGIKKINILISYIIAPCVITFLGSLVGLLLGAKVLYLLPIHSLSGYYSIPDCKVNLDAAVILVAIFAPVILIAIINSLSILKVLNRKPLQLIRHDLKKTRGMNKSHLNFGSFDFRFRLRVFASSMGAYVLLFIGIFLGGFLMMFGVGMSSSFDGYIEEQKNNSLCKYQYCVSDGYEIKNDAVEEATVGNFEYTDKKLKQTYSISGIGVIKNSDFFKKINRLTSDEIIISKDTAQKFVLKKDDVIKLENLATGQVDKYKIKDVVDYNLGLCFFTQQSEMNNILLKDVNYHNYYFSNKKIDIPKKYLVSKLSVEDYVSNGQVMKNAMKSMIMMFPTVAVIIYMIIMYILIKLVISQNEIGISMLKVFGFTESEIRKMYINTNTIITILFVLISLPLQYNFMVSIWPACIKTIPGYIGFVMEGKHLLIIALTGIVCYFIANVTSLNKVKKVPMVIALKNQDI